MIANRAVSSSLQENPEVDQDYDSDDELLPADHYEGIGLRDDSTSSYDAVTASFSKALRPTASVTISFEDLTVRTRRGKRSGPATVWRPVIENQPAADEVMLLDHVSGYAEPGEVLAIMGPSGSGKSTLLNVIMNRNLSPKFDVSGVVRVNGYEIGRKIARISGYLQQNDLLFPSLTVAEYLRFQVALCLGDVLDSTQQDEKVLNMLSTMGLLSCQHTKIGQPGLGKSISGGEMKRLAFAAELLSDPAVLFCDEPTTGLDSFRAEQVVAVLRQLALLGKTIICVIHQPSSTVFEMFNRIIFLANGRVAFQGQIACAKNFFESIGHFCPQNSSLADHAVNLSTLTPGEEHESENRIATICDAYDSSAWRASVTDQISAILPSIREDSPFAGATEVAVRYRVSFFTQLYWLIWRALMDLIRNPRILRTRIIQKIILGLVYGLTFHGTVVLTQAGIQNANGAMLSLVIESSFRILLNIVQMYNAQLPILRRESGSFMYRPVAYYLALLISWFPVFLIDTTIFMSIAYFLMGLSMDATKFALTLAVSLAIANVSAAVGSFIAYICPSVGVGVAIAQQMQYIVMVFSGALYIALHSFPVYLGWLQYLSWIRYGFEAMSIIHWRDIGNISCTENFTETCRATGQIVLHSEDYLESRLGFDFYMLGVLFAGFHLAAFCSLILRLRRRNSG